MGAPGHGIGFALIMDSAGDDREALAGGGYLMTLRDFGRSDK